MASVRKSSKIPADALAALLRQFAEGTTLTSDGNISFQTFNFRDVLYLLPDAFDVTAQIDRREVRSMLTSALFNVRKTGNVTERAVIAEANRLASEILSRPQTKFSMWTKLRVSQAAFSRGFRIEVNGVLLEARAYLPTYMRKGEFFLNGYGRIDPNDPPFMGHLLGYCDARNAEQAADRIIEAMTLFMGLVNIHRMRGRWTIMGGEARPEGDLWLGPYQFIQHRRRFLEDKVWYNPEYDSSFSSFAVPMEKLRENIPRARLSLKQLANHPMRGLLERVILLVQDGMAARDTNFRLLRYWAALENLYSKEGDRKDNEKTIKRATFAEREQVISRWTLRHIANLRNEYVHLREIEGDVQALCQHVRDILTRHICWLIANGDRFASHKEFVQMADLPSGAELTELRHLLELRDQIVS